MSLLDQLGISQSLRMPAECKVYIDDTEIESLYIYLREVSVEAARGAATSCTLLFDSVRDEKGDWAVQDSGQLTAWKKIRIVAAWGSQEEEVMRGYIKEVNVEYPTDMGAASVTVTGQDDTMLLDREQINYTWSTEEIPVTDGQVVKEIAAGVGLKDDAATGLQNGALTQDETNIQFLMKRAEANGYELYAREGVLTFKPIDLDGDPQPPIKVYAGRSTNCLSFSAKYDGHKPDKVILVRAAEEGAEAEEERFESNLPLLGDKAATSTELGVEGEFAWKLEQAAGSTLEEARARAQAKANDNAWKITAQGELDGSLYGHVLLTHLTVAVDGVGDTFGGRYYVHQVKHMFSADGYRQNFSLLRNATGGEGDAAALSTGIDF